jgi:hypothetical protein
MANATEPLRVAPGSTAHSINQCGISAPVFNRASFAKKVKNDSFGFRCAKDTLVIRGGK